MDQKEQAYKDHQPAAASSGVHGNGWFKHLPTKGMDPQSTWPTKISAEEIARVRQQVMPLLVHAETMSTALLTKIKQFESERTFGALMFDATGVLVKIYGRKQVVTWLEKHHICRWTRWSEELIGRNIFSEGMQANGYVRMEGKECFASCFHGLTWYFEPVRRADRSIWGGLVLVCPAEQDSTLFPYVLTTITAGIFVNTNWFHMMEYCTSGTEGMGFIVIDCSNHKRRLITIGREVFRILSLPVSDYYYEPLERYFSPKPANSEFWNIINNRQEVSDKMVTLSSGGRHTDVCLSTTSYQVPELNTDAMVVIINSIGRIQRLASKQPTNSANFTFSSMIGQSSVFLEAARRAENASYSESNVLLLGESGVGKDVFAQAIHNSSRRRKGPFVAVNCAAFSKELIASELFGYEEGAFTGARRGGSIGKFELADNGTLFLDEIGDMPQDLQAVLLRTLEERCFRKVGGTRVHQANVRIIAATNKDLREKMKNGLFREDLFYRLGVVRITVPPLRQRENDILLFANGFIENICERQNRSLSYLTPDAQDFFLTYQWPGNVRELRNLLEGIISTHDRQDIDADTVIRYLGYEGITVTAPPPALYHMPSERERMVQALNAYHGNRSKAADAMGMSRSTFYRRMKEYNI